MTPAITDSTLVRDSLSDANAFAGIFDRHFPEIHSFLRRRVGNEVADDVAAEVFLVAFRRREDFDLSRADIRPWLYGIAVNQLSAHRRKEIRGYRALARHGVDPTFDNTGEIDNRVAAQADQRLLAKALQGLKKGDRDVLLLHAWADLDHAAIAEALELPVGTVKSRLARARKSVAAEMANGPAARPEAISAPEAT